MKPKTLLIIVLIFSLADSVYKLIQIFYQEKQVLIHNQVDNETDELISSESYAQPLPDEKIYPPDYAGRLIILGTDVDYWVVQGSDNSFYLTHDAFLNDNPYGSLFLDYRTRESDRMKVIYGHNTDNGLMLAFLDEYRKQKIADEYPVIQFDDKNYELLSVNEISLLDEWGYWQIFDLNTSSQLAIIEKYAIHSLVKTTTSYDEESDFIILSTCVMSDPNLRLIVIGQHKEDKNMEDQNEKNGSVLLY